MGDGRFRRQAALDQPRRGGCLHDGFFAGPARIFGTARDQHPELGRHDVEPFAHVLADPMEGARTARASFILDIDYDLDPRQVRRQRPAVGPARRCLSRSGGRRCHVGCGLFLLDLFEGKKHLVFGQRLGAPSEPVALHLFDDLNEPGVVLAFSDHHRLQGGRIIGQRLRQSRHGCMESRVVVARETFATPNDAFVALSSLQRNGNIPGIVNAPPIEPLKQGRQLRGRQSDHAVLDRGPAEGPILEPLREQAHTRAVLEDHLDPVGASGAEHVDRAGERVGFHRVPHQGGKSLRAFAEVDRLRRRHHADRARRADHRPPFKARMIDVTMPTSAPRPTQTLATFQVEADRRWLVCAGARCLDNRGHKKVGFRFAD